MWRARAEPIESCQIRDRYCRRRALARSALCDKIGGVFVVPVTFDSAALLPFKITRVVVATLFLGIGMACGSTGTPTAPTPTPTPTPPPVAAEPTLACPDPVLASTTAAAGIAVTYAAPTAEGGQAPVSVTCTPESGTMFRIGQTSVECSATDALERTASCAFPVAVTRIPSISKTRFLAFGDSITAGEVTVPVASSGGFGPRSFKLVQVPAAAYPTVLAIQLAARYRAQEDAIAVANYGLGGEKAINARDRFIAALDVVRPDAVLLMEGSNDIGRGEDGAASGAAQEIRNMAAEARRCGMRVFIATIAPGRPGSKTIAPFLITDYNNRMRTVAASEGAILVDVNAALSTDVNRYIGIDGLHPTELGYARIAETFFAAIRAEFEVP
ncbi:MAG: HYR domain-containing protein [Acidobacteria bacterium]|nr:HYR domain-containing protein [Acidobacteriota bacterium]